MAGLSDQELQAALAQMGGGKMPAGETYVRFADGTTHMVRRDDSGGISDEGAVASKAPPVNKPLLQKMSDGSVWSFSLNQDGSAAASTQLLGPNGKPPDPALESERDSRSRLIDQQLANAEAMAPYNLDKAKATIASLNARTDLEPAQKDLINARVGRIASQNSVDPSRIGLNNAAAGKDNAQTSLYTAEGQMKLQNSFFAVQQQVNTLNSMVGKPGGPATQQDADVLSKQLYDRAALEAATGITAADAAKNALTVQRQQVDQADNRATNAAGVFNNSGNIAMDAAKGGAGGPAAAGGFLAMLNAAPQFQSNMGGAPVNIQSATVTPDDMQQIAQLVTSGQAPADANGNRYANAVKMHAQNKGILSPDQNGGAAPNPNASNGLMNDSQFLGPGGGKGFLGSLSGQSFGGIPVSATGTDLGVFPGQGG